MYLVATNQKKCDIITCGSIIDKNTKICNTCINKDIDYQIPNMESHDSNNDNSNNNNNDNPKNINRQDRSGPFNRIINGHIILDGANAEFNLNKMNYKIDFDVHYTNNKQNNAAIKLFNEAIYKISKHNENI